MFKKALIAIALIALGAFLWETLPPIFLEMEVDDAAPDILTESPSKISVGDAAVTDAPPATSTDQTVADTETKDFPPEQDRFPIEGTPNHPASGYVRVIETPEEQIIRYEDYDGTIGPDLYVYLAKDLDASEFIDLGLLRSNTGTLNYGVPIDVDLDAYTYVLTWCKSCDALYDYARINE